MENPPAGDDGTTTVGRVGADDDDHRPRQRTVFYILIDAARREVDEYDVNDVVDAFRPVLGEFESYTQGAVEIAEEYRATLVSFIDFLKSTFDIAGHEMFVYVEKYSKNMWGPLYWRFLHYSSILLQYALYERLTHDVREFPTIVYNVDRMLPCSDCARHYRLMKRDESVKHVIRQISYGHVVQGVYTFHNMVTGNIERSNRLDGRYRGPTDGETRKVFGATDFAALYNCYPLTTVRQDGSHTTGYCKPEPDWQTPLHTHIAQVLSINYNVPYYAVSDYLKGRSSSSHWRPERPHETLDYCIANRRPMNEGAASTEEATRRFGAAVDAIRVTLAGWKN